MHIAVASSHTPLVEGGAELLTRNLMQACSEAGYDVSLLTYPLCDVNPELISQAINQWSDEDFRAYGERQPDMVICLKFPAFYLQHDCRINWILHQHRSVYELWDWQTGQGYSPSDDEIKLRDVIIRADNQHIGSALQNMSISKTVSNRLLHYNNIVAEPLYHPPPHAELLTPAKLSLTEDYIFAPSRLEPLKRQALLVEALSMTKNPVKAVICGQGSQRTYLQTLIAKYGLSNRVQLLDYVDQTQLVELYRRALAVFFAPYDEDYGYVTLEAMAAARPVITCYDSGGPTEFIQHEQTGYCEAPDPLFIAERLDNIFVNRKAARNVGDDGYDYYTSLNLNWSDVVERLVS